MKYVLIHFPASQSLSSEYIIDINTDKNVDNRVGKCRRFLQHRIFLMNIKTTCVLTLCKWLKVFSDAQRVLLMIGCWLGYYVHNDNDKTE